MGKAIEAAMAHFASLGRKSIEVPEWQVDGAPLLIYWTPLTIAERNAFAEGDSSDVTIVVAKATDADGNKLFTIEDKPKLRRVSAHVVNRIAAAILAAPKLADAEKN